METVGLINVRTYIQSGNIVFASTKMTGSNIEELIPNKFGFTPDVLLLSENEFTTSVENNPYKKYEGKYVHF